MLQRILNTGFKKLPAAGKQLALGLFMAAMALKWGLQQRKAEGKKLPRTLKYGALGLGVLGAATGVHLYRRRKQQPLRALSQSLTNDIHQTRALVGRGHVKRSTVEQTLRRLMKARKQVEAQKYGSVVAAYEASRDNQKKLAMLLGKDGKVV